MIVYDCHLTCDHEIYRPHNMIIPVTTHRVRDEDGELATVERAGPELFTCASCGCMLGTYRPRCLCLEQCH
jgi:hypothetical protein